MPETARDDPVTEFTEEDTTFRYHAGILSKTLTNLTTHKVSL